MIQERNLYVHDAFSKIYGDVYFISREEKWPLIHCSYDMWKDSGGARNKI
jgi:hypothetical protein